jgi:hypothetical protein
MSLTSIWYKNDFDEGFYLEKANGKLVCSLHPKPSRDYAFFLLRRFFDKEEHVWGWYNTRNFWYGDVAPKDMSDTELIKRIQQMVNSVYI